MAGVDLLTIKELGGWRPLSMVARYAHLSPSHRSQAIERLVTRAATIEDTRLPERSSTVISTAKIDQKPDVREVCGKCGAGGGS